MKTQSTTPGLMLQQVTDLLSGLTSNPPGGMTSLVIEGKRINLADLGVELQKYKDTYEAVEDAHLEYKLALAARETIEATVQRRCDAVRGALRGSLGKTNQALALYGVTPAKTPRPLTAEEDLVRVAKAKATRAARHTMGRKQRLAIKGTLPAKPEA